MVAAYRETPLISLADDGYVPEPSAMAERLLDATKNTQVKADYYGNGGAVTEFEQTIAQHLGKESAVMFPTGTLANLIAMKRLTGGRGRRIIVHRQSHLFNDSGDNLSQLGGFTMLPLDNGSGGFDAIQVQEEIERTATARVASDIGCIAVESPNRRLFGRRFGQDDLTAVCDMAAGQKIPLFLDGARMLIESVYSGQQPSEMAARFDLVYMSLYKYLGAPFGCILAGRHALLEEIFHDRRRYGGGLYQMWPAAVLAGTVLPRVAKVWSEIIPHSEMVIAQLNREPCLKVERVPDGTNIFLLSQLGKTMHVSRIKDNAARLDLTMPEPVGNRLPVKINETWLNTGADDLAQRICHCLDDSSS